MWNLYSGTCGYYGNENSIIDAFNKVNDEELLKDAIIEKQPFPNNEHIGKYTGDMFSHFKEIIKFELSPENTHMHIVCLTHFDEETLYLIKKKYAPFYFGDESWSDYDE